ncbi:MAG: cbb3-type cytochrome c oxidase subunit I [Balneolaceae bacterium]|nr:cbb3-type cytochrome c oxidase subunit I [Balneolaceae bacterium]
MSKPSSILSIQRPLTVEKAKAEERIDTDKKSTKLIFWYVACSAFWLVFGTLVGEYLGLKFVWPELDSLSWLSFGRLRPVHTNVVFWGYTSLSMIALALYIVPRTSQQRLYSYRLGWVALAFMNIAVLEGVISLMMGINNGGQEYREFVWPVMALFALGLIATAYNLYKTIAQREVKEIYISNWYILASFLWTIVLATIAYLPGYQQDGISETVIQGYYMHQGVGMWFTPMVLGITYYFLPKLLNKPIYSYSLGVLAFWTQMLFYTMIGAHHFVFSPIPWWIQTVAIVFSVGMFVPVTAGTGNFLLTMRGSWRTIARSYSLPFILTGVLFYAIVSYQGTLEAFRSLNKVWHFTNYTVAHSHMSMYGFVAFLIWGGIYGLMPRLTGNEPPQISVGAHFWLALIGLLLYSFSLMIGGTLQGMSWIEGSAFMESVTLMAPYWVWRAVGGTMMFFSHLIFAYNVWKMRPTQPAESKETLTAKS